MNITDIPRQSLTTGRLSFGSAVGECLGNHFVKTSLVNTDILTATAEYAAVLLPRHKHFPDAVLMATQYLAWTDLVIAP